MPSEARLKKTNRTIKRGPKKLNFGASKPGVRGGPGPLGPPLDPLVRYLTRKHSSRMHTARLPTVSHVPGGDEYLPLDVPCRGEHPSP